MWDMKNERVALVLLPEFWPNLPPLGLAALKGYLSDKGIGSKCLDYNAVHDKDMVKTLLGYDVIGMSCYKSNFESVLKVSAALKSHRPDIRIIFGGPEMTRLYFQKGGALWDELKDCADLIVAGEGEVPVLEYLESGAQKKGLVLFDEIKDSSQYAVPDFSDFSLDLYPKKSAVSVYSSKGCIRRCAFCAEKLLYKRFRTLPVDNVISQIRLNKEHGIKQFIFHDSLINGDLASLERLLDGIIGNFGSVPYEAQIAIRNDMPESLFEKMKRSGCYNLFIGLESGCGRTLERMKKGFGTADAVDFFKALNRHALAFGISVITGFPGESDRDFKESMSFVLEHKGLIPKIEQVNPFTYYDGTGFSLEDDYKHKRESLERARVFAENIKSAGFKFTKAFMLNLVEQPWK